MTRRTWPRRAIPAALLAGLGVGGCMSAGEDQWAQTYPVGEDSFPVVPEGRSLDVLVLGDWGTGGEGQRSLAAAIAETHEFEPPRLVITVGDNVYEEGVTSADDPRWDEVFTSVYTGPFWDEMEFRPALGNHDYRGNPDAQIDFSQRDPRWLMPARYFSFELELPGGGIARFLALDTNFGGMDEAEVAEEVDWVRTTLREPKPEWVITYGHHPIAGGGPREPSKKTRENLGRLIGVGSDLHLAGHDHITQLTRVQTLPLHAICGGGNGWDNPYDTGENVPGELVAFTGGGWCLVRLWETQGAIELYDALGRLQHREMFEPRR